MEENEPETMENSAPGEPGVSQQAEPEPKPPVEAANISNTIVGAVRSQQVSIESSAAGAVAAGNDINVDGAVVAAMAAGNSATISNSGAGAVIVGGDADLSNSFINTLIVGGKAKVKGSFIALLFADKAELGDGTRVLLNTRQAIIFALVFGLASGSLSALLRRATRRR